MEIHTLHNRQTQHRIYVAYSLFLKSQYVGSKLKPRRVLKNNSVCLLFAFFHRAEEGGGKEGGSENQKKKHICSHIHEQEGKTSHTSQWIH